eukprot:942821-Pleurochrysis_carterae.AAC.2
MGDALQSNSTASANCSAYEPRAMLTWSRLIDMSAEMLSITPARSSSLLIVMVAMLRPAPPSVWLGNSAPPNGSRSSSCTDNPTQNSSSKNRRDNLKTHTSTDIETIPDLELLVVLELAVVDDLDLDALVHHAFGKSECARGGGEICGSHGRAVLGLEAASDGAAPVALAQHLDDHLLVALLDDQLVGEQLEHRCAVVVLDRH